MTKTNRSALLAIVCLVGTTASAKETSSELYFSSGHDLRKACVRDTQSRWLPDMRIGIYVEGVMDTQALASQSGISKTSCLPEGVTRKMLTDTVCDYLQTDTTVLDRSGPSVVFAALAKKYPCLD